MACTITIHDILSGDADNVLTIVRDQGRSTITGVTSAQAFRNIGNAFLRAATVAQGDGSDGGTSLSGIFQVSLNQ